MSSSTALAGESERLDVGDSRRCEGARAQAKAERAKAGISRQGLRADSGQQRQQSTAKDTARYRGMHAAGRKEKGLAAGVRCMCGRTSVRGEEVDQDKSN